MNEIFHNGEIEIQRKVGEEIIANANGRIVADTIVKATVPLH